MEKNGEKILLVDDHIVVRTGLKTLLQEIYAFAEIDQAVDGPSMLERLAERTYDIVITDIRMPNTDVTDMVSTALKKYPDIRILIYSVCSENIYGKRLLKAGVKGFLSKDASYNELKKAVDLVINNKKYLSEKLVDILTTDLMHDRPSDPFAVLSPREFEIVNLLLSGKTVSEIGNILGIQASTVGTHKGRIFEKLNIENVLELRDLAESGDYEGMFTRQQ
jgi:two-component system invasion response regulator UvrY